jgi:8-oxo-dGTP pyrophosphatase MutT (NUDIX family)
MHVRIYFGDKTVYLCDEVPSFLEAALQSPTAVCMEELSEAAVKSVIRELSRPEIRTGILLHPDLERLQWLFRKNFQVIQAAGGLVRNGRGEWLMIHRRGLWDLPKGKLDEGESLEACAQREVMEETGLPMPELGERICVTYHTYKESGRMFLKESHWYSMRVEGVPDLVPQTEEDITGIAWLDREGVKNVLPLAYPSIRDVMEEAAIT